ncbi:putative photosynthetic complex assembly protein PuhE [Gymnodinialimonas sp. 2305UL16-5]|uniref:putative photosynthetic complex assembly protein PuhE n=1 Tax=Gymnodinialimonas mytili TaxID=3126503 RepID=UPI003098B7B4
MLASPWIAALAALFVWWFSTGAILLAVRKADRAGPHARLWVCLMNLPFLVLGAAGFVDTLNNGTVAGTYVAFLSALALWGWIELAFLTGTITGPVTSDARHGVPEWERFIRAWGTIAYHEMLLVAVLLAMIGLSWGTDNQFGTWTFALLFVARISAKLNLYLGVRKINVEFIPEPLNHLPSHFRHARMNWLFPISITGLSFAVACWLERLWAAETGADVVGFALLSALTALALLEHWFMVLPLPDEKLWRWMLPDREAANQAALPSEEAR